MFAQGLDCVEQSEVVPRQLDVLATLEPRRLLAICCVFQLGLDLLDTFFQPELGGLVDVREHGELVDLGIDDLQEVVRQDRVVG